MDKGKGKGGAAVRGGGAAGRGAGRGAAQAAGQGAAGRGSALAVRGGVSKKGRGRGAATTEGQDDGDAASDFKKLGFNKDLRPMMYGFGDHQCPLDETVDLVEDIVIEYMKEATLRAAAAAADALKTKMDEKDLLFSVRKDPAKFARVKELLLMQQVIKEARNSFKEVAPEDVEEGGEAPAA